jgi:hypothetical protein
VGKSLADLSGDRYGRLIVTSFFGMIAGNRPEKLWVCTCDCGNIIKVRQNNLRSGHTQSCGCYKEERISESNKKHGMRNCPEYAAWCSMKGRCLNPNNKKYPRYGGRGIAVCKRWLNSFEDFYLDVGKRPNSSYTLERINLDGNYCPENCKWATHAEQNRNYSRNVYIEYEGRKMCLQDWANEVGIGVHTLRYRIRSGWPIRQALFKPVK